MWGWAQEILDCAIYLLPADPLERLWVCMSAFSITVLIVALIVDRDAWMDEL